MQKRRTHSVKSDRYVSFMITTNTAESGRFVRIHKLFFLILPVVLIIAAFYVGIVVGDTRAHISALNQEIELVHNENQLLSSEKAAEKATAEAVIAEKEAMIDNLKASISEKELQLNILKTQAQDILDKLETLEAFRDSIYEKLGDVPLDLYTSEDSPSVAPYSIAATTSSYYLELDMQDEEEPADTDDIIDSLETETDFNKKFAQILSLFTSINDSLDTNYDEFNNISNLVDAYIPYANAMPTGYPVKNTHITCEFGKRIDPVKGTKAFHAGVDLYAKYKQDIFATAPGKVISAGYSKDYGYNIIIDHGYGFVTRYAHCSKLLVKKGAEVERGTRIALAGSSGKSTAVHLHYEVKINGVAVNPVDYLH